MNKIMVAGSALLGLCAAPVAAQQFTARQADVVSSSSYDLSNRYIGPGYTDNVLGAVDDGGRDAFDTFGYYTTANGADGSFNGLTLNRQTETLSGNTFRFFDSFTNNTGTSITAKLNFYGNLGSDGNEDVRFNDGGTIVSCQNFGAGCENDAVLALVAGNNGFLAAAVGENRYDSTFTLTLGAGETAGILQFAFLASEASGTNNTTDVTLARDTGISLRNAPRLEGLTATQVASIRNYTLSPAGAVPEPSAWAMMILGFGLVGAAVRGRKVAALAA